MIRLDQKNLHCFYLEAEQKCLAQHFFPLHLHGLYSMYLFCFAKAIYKYMSKRNMHIPLSQKYYSCLLTAAELRQRGARFMLIFNLTVIRAKYNLMEGR